MIKSFSVVAMAALVMVGCNSGGDSASQTSSFVNKNTKAATISGLDNLGKSVSSDKISTDKISNTAKSYDIRDDSESTNDQPCQSGTLNIDENPPNFSMNAQNCKNGSTTINGAFNAKISEASKTGAVEVTKDFSVVDEEMNLFVSKGSKVTMSEQTIRADFQLKAENL